LYLPKHDLSIVVLSHIGYDFSKIEDEFKALLATFQNTISDEMDYQEAALKKIHKQYLDTRGFEIIAEKLR